MLVLKLLLIEGIKVIAINTGIMRKAKNTVFLNTIYIRKGIASIITITTESISNNLFLLTV